MTCPRCGYTLSTREAARSLSKLRRKGGWPKGKRRAAELCACGKFSRETARKRNHKCKEAV